MELEAEELLAVEFIFGGRYDEGFCDTDCGAGSLRRGDGVGSAIRIVVAGGGWDVDGSGGGCIAGLTSVRSDVWLRM